MSGQEERLICEVCDPEKQHIAPFSCLVHALADSDAKRGANHRFNNIGNLTYISAILNHYETGLGSTPIDRSIEPKKNLAAHYLSDDGHLGKVGQLYDQLKLDLCDKEGSPQETIDRRFEAFCKARRRLIAQGFLSWLDDLSRSAEEVMSKETLRLKAVTPRCIGRQYLPLTQQIRSMDYPNDIENALVGYVRHTEKHHDLKKRRKFRENEIELRLSEGGAVRLLMSSAEIRVLYHDWITSELSAPVDAMLGIAQKDHCLYQRGRGGAVTLDLLHRGSVESERLDGLEQDQRELARRNRNVICDPTFISEPHSSPGSSTDR